MPIAGYKPTVDPIVTEPNLPVTEPANYKSIIYDDKNQPLQSLIGFIEGSPWSVDYYSQILSRDNDLREVDPGQPNVLQQYQEIKELEIRVNGPLSSSYDSDTGITTVTGDALIYPFMIPNVSDYFVSDTNDNRRGIFRVTGVERNTLNRDSVYSINYDMVGYVETTPDIYNELLSKTIKTYQFSKDRLIEGLSPTLKTSDYAIISGLQDTYLTIVRRYFRTFFNKQYFTLVLPGQDHAIYDSYLVDYILKIVDQDEADEVRNIKQLPTDQDLHLNQPQFWELLLYRDYTMLDEVNSNMAIANKAMFNANSYLHGLRFTNIEYIIYPLESDETILINKHAVKKNTLNTPDLIEPTNHGGSIADILNGSYTDGLTTIPIIKTVTTDTKYVLSDAFYSATTDLSLLEQLTKSYIQGLTLDLGKITELANAYETWGRLEQFYYGPILMTLLKQLRRETY